MNFVRDNLWELVLGLGGLCAFAGVALWLHVPAALTVLGLGLILLSFWGAARWGS